MQHLRYRKESGDITNTYSDHEINTERRLHDRDVKGKKNRKLSQLKRIKSTNRFYNIQKSPK